MNRSSLNRRQLLVGGLATGLVEVMAACDSDAAVRELAGKGGAAT